MVCIWFPQCHGKLFFFFGKIEKIELRTLKHHVVMRQRETAFITLMYLNVWIGVTIAKTRL